MIKLADLFALLFFGAFLRLDIFGSKSSNTTENITTAQNTNFSEVAGPAATVQGENNALSISVLDGGAINRSFDFAGGVFDRSIGAIETTSRDAFTAVDQASRRTVEGADQAIQKITETARGETRELGNKALTYGAILAGVLILARVAPKFLKA